MATTTRQMATIAGISEQSVRNYTRRYGELLSPSARGEGGARLFTDKDVQILCSVATLLREGVSSADVVARLRAGEIFVDATPQQTTPSHNNAIDATQTLMLVRSDLQRQIDALRRTQTLLLRGALLWGVMLGAIAGLGVGAFILWALWLMTR